MVMAMSRTRNRTRQNVGISRFFWRILVSYLVFMLSLGLALALMYQKASALLTDQLRESNQTYLEHIQELVDQAIGNANAILDQLMIDPAVTSLSAIDQLTDGSARFYELRQAISDIPKYNLTNNLIKDYLLVFPRSGIVLRSGSAFLEDPRRQIHGDGLRLTSTLTALAASNSSVIKGHALVVLDGTPYAVLNSPDPIAGESRRFIAVALNTDVLSGYLNRLDLGKNGEVVVTDPNGQTIVARTDPPGSSAVSLDTFNLKDYAVTEIASPLTGWKFGTAVRKDVVYQRAFVLKWFSFLVVLAYLIVGLVIASIAAYRRSAPLAAMLDSLRTVGATASTASESVNSLETEVRALVRAYWKAMETSSEQRAFLESSFLSRLFQGQYSTVPEIEALRHLAEFPELPAPFTAIAIEWRSFQDAFPGDAELVSERRGLGTIWRGILNHHFEGHVYFHQFSIDRLGVLICGVAREELVEVVRSILNEAPLRSLVSASSFVVLGQTDDMLDVGGLFAKQVPFADFPGKSTVPLVLDQGEEIIAPAVKYTVERESRLIRFVELGEHSRVTEELRGLWNAVYREGDGDASAADLLLGMLAGTLVRAADRTHARIPKDLRLGEPGEPLDRFRALEKGFATLIAHRATMLADARTGRPLEIEAYVRERFADPQLNIDVMARHFGLTPKAMYKQFRQQFGVTFASYLERLRVDAACRLLKDTDTPIQEVSTATGFGTDHTFRRVFRRRLGTSPSEYRGQGVENRG